jgi:CHAT domain-containing protein/tetratricopeptide (TPR) repeat protein
MKRASLILLVLSVLLSAAAAPGASGAGGDAADFLARGKEYYRQSEYHDAAEAFGRALALTRAQGDERGSAEALYQLGTTYAKLKDYERALATLEESLEIYERLGDRWGMGECELEIGYAYYFDKRYDEALRHFNRMLTCFTEIGSQVGRGIALSNIGMVSAELGDYEAALSYYERALSMYRNAGNDTLAVIALKRIARAYGTRQEYERELSALSEALQIVERTDDRAEEAGLLSSIGVDYALLGEYDRAIVFLDQSLALFRSLGDKTGEGYALVHSGSALNNLGRYEEGLQRYEAARKVFGEIDDPVGSGFATAGMAFSHHELGHRFRSFLLFSRVLRLADRATEETEIAEDPLILGMLAAGMERYRRAIPQLETALEDGLAHDDLMKIGYSAGYLGYSYKALGKYEKAVDDYAIAIDVLERVRGDIRQEGHKTSFMKSKIEVYEDIIEILVKLGRWEEAFDYVERARSRALLDLLGTRRLEVTGKRNRDLLGRNEELSGRMAQLMKPPGEPAGNGTDEGASDDVNSRGLGETAEEYGSLIEEVRSENPELASLITVAPLTLDGVRKLMDDDMRIVEYFTTADRTYIFSVGADDLTVYAVPVTRDELSDKVTSLRDVIRSTIEPGDIDAVKGPARGLYDILIAPIAGDAAEQRLVIIPHGPLHYLPFAALFDGHRFLIERYTIVVDPSASVLEYVIEKRKKANGAGIAFGNPVTKYSPLPFAQREVADIRSIMKHIDVYIGAEATETRARKYFKRYSIIHLACHGVFDPADPLSSALFLSGDAQNDGVLAVNELFGLDLARSSLVVLSACETGLSEVMRGDELIGLSRGFIYSGTPSLVVTLWEVADDSTAVLMAQFYRNLTNGIDKPESLRRAVLWLREQPGFEHPFFWAPFVMIGDWR